jgi:hypothetical protein
MNTQTTDILSRKQAARYLGICMTTLERSNIPHTKLRRRVVYRKSTIDSWLQANEIAHISGQGGVTTPRSGESHGKPFAAPQKGVLNAGGVA